MVALMLRDEVLTHSMVVGELACGLVDMSLLASTLMTPGANLWTLDKRPATLAPRFDIAFDVRR